MENKEIIITYENLYEILRREKFRTELQKLEPNFFEQVKKYIDEKRAILQVQKTKDSIFASTEVEKTKIQLKNIQKILKELYDKREGKIVQLALFHSRSLKEVNMEPLLEQEKEFYKTIKNALDSSRSLILMDLLAEREIICKQKSLKTTKNQDSIKLRLLKDVPEFVGPDLKTYGPYKKDKVLEIKNEIANMLITQKQAEKNENS